MRLILVATVTYLSTSVQHTPESSRVLAVYPVAFAVQFLHFAEEFSTEFYTRWPVEVFNAAPFELTTFVQINMVSYAAFALGAAAIYRGIKGPMLIVWFFTSWGSSETEFCIPCIRSSRRGSPATSPGSTRPSSEDSVKLTVKWMPSGDMASLRRLAWMCRDLAKHHLLRMYPGEVSPSSSKRDR
jgi:hypothetical protein